MTSPDLMIKPIKNLNELTLKNANTIANWLEEHPEYLDQYDLNKINKEILALIDKSGSASVKRILKKELTFKCHKLTAGWGLQGVTHDNLLYMTKNTTEIDQAKFNEYPQEFCYVIGDKTIQRPAVGGKKISIDAYHQFIYNHVCIKSFWIIPKVIMLFIGDMIVENGEITFLPGGFFLILDGQTQCLARHRLAADGVRCDDIIDVEVVHGISLVEARNQFANNNLQVKCPSNQVEAKDSVDHAAVFFKDVRDKTPEDHVLHKHVQCSKTLKYDKSPHADLITSACLKTFLKTFCLGEKGVTMSQHRALDIDVFTKRAIKAAHETLDRLVAALLVPLMSNSAGNSAIYNSVLRHTPVWAALGRIAFESQLHLIKHSSDRQLLINGMIQKLSNVNWTDIPRWVGICLKNADNGTGGIKECTKRTYWSLNDPSSKYYNIVRGAEVINMPPSPDVPSGTTESNA